VDAPHRLVWTFNGDRYSFDLSGQNNGCWLVFTHTFEDRSLAAQTAAGWEIYLSRLEPHLNGEFLSEEDAHQQLDEVRKRYVKRFWTSA